MMRTVVSLLLACVFVIGCATVPFTGRSQLSLVPQADLVTSASESYNQLLAQSQLSTNSEDTRAVVHVGERVAMAAEDFMREMGMTGELRYYDWEFSLIEEDETINAFCMPGGRIGVFTGILPVARDDNGLAVIMAHEVAHALANHSGERLSQLLLAELGGMALSSAMQEKPQEAQELAMMAFGLGAQLGVLLPYSRQHESEADRIGLILMSRAGYDPRHAIPFWSRMNEQGGARPPEFLSTHPAPDTRIAQIKSYLPEALQYYKE
jgi:predicted Zn-dependent protease